MESNAILYNKQFGFRKNHSTAHAIIEVVDKKNKLLISGKLLSVSDTNKHDNLFKKLEHCGIRGLALTWLKSYLTDRFQQVYYAKKISNLVPITCGVPQGSILGPLLFLIYINDIANCTTNLLFYLFADDTSVFITGEKDQTLFENMNCELPNISNWFNANFLSLSPNKSNYIIFTSPRNKLPEDPNKSIILTNIAIKRVSNVKFLGVIIDEHLTWKSHINLVKHKAAKMIGIIKRLKALPLSALKILYNAFLTLSQLWNNFMGEAIKLHSSLSTYFRRKLSD